MNREKKTVTVLIPTFHPDGKLRELLRRLGRQDPKPERVLIINTVDPPQGAGDGADSLKRIDGESAVRLSDLVDEFRGTFRTFSVFHISPSEFNHGGTRDLGVRFADTDFVLCMTQDALPRDRHLLRNLKKAFDDPKTAAAYARQLPGKRADAIEAFSRSFNYPPQSQTKTKKDLDRLGIKTFFCSDVCAMWKKEIYLQLGGFDRHVIFNEDMILAGRMVQAGYQIAYCADAMVYHSHCYSIERQMRRSFDLGVSQADCPEVFSMASSGKEGLRYLKEGTGFLLRSHHVFLVPRLAVSSAFRYIGYQLGRNYRVLPGSVVLRLTDNPSYWEN